MDLKLGGIDLWVEQICFNKMDNENHDNDLGKAETAVFRKRKHARRDGANEHANDRHERAHKDEKRKEAGTRNVEEEETGGGEGSVDDRDDALDLKVGAEQFGKAPNRRACLSVSKANPGLICLAEHSQRSSKLRKVPHYKEAEKCCCEDFIYEARHGPK